MDSTAVFRRGFSTAPLPHLPTTPSVIGRQLAFTFRCNVSSVQLLVEKSKENYNRYGRLNKNNNGIDIRCGRFNKSLFKSKDRGSFPSPNARFALQSLLCFSYTTKGVEYADYINIQKNKALQALLDQNPNEAMRIMSTVYDKYKNDRSPQAKYESILAFVQILIHMGTDASWGMAIEKLGEIVNLKDLPSDAKPYLYQAVICTLLGDVDKSAVKKYWGQYVNLLDGDLPKIW